ncbi:4130_t:CDS:2 [Diversispora eburnea]|uniref:4130_t:CDS:1 n=1 Tax=Diversispora eburnea TaxID=1213867 RepID=A0A9N9AQK5_9GLOM|nr:4130_t:CDS:2 [Diversispora eburnea]
MGKLVLLFIERFNKNATRSPPPPPGFGFALKSKVIPYERKTQYRLYYLYDGLKLDFFEQTQYRFYDLYEDFKLDIHLIIIERLLTICIYSQPNEHQNNESEKKEAHKKRTNVKKRPTLLSHEASALSSIC